MILAIWNCFYTPLEIAFNLEVNSALIIGIDTCIDLLFILDIYFNFRTTYFSTVTGEEVFDRAMIARNYLMGKFWIDLVSCVPVEFILYITHGNEESEELGSRTIFSLLSLLKIYRISRLNHLINFMRTKSDVKMAIRIIQLLFFILMYIHLVSCAW